MAVATNLLEIFWKIF